MELFNFGEKFDIIEMGCGCGLANFLLSQPGASKFINQCYQPYSKESQEKLFGKAPRSVSKEMIELVLDSYETNVLVASFQLRDKETNSLTHGWVGVKVGGRKSIYHLSYISSYDRFGGEINRVTAILNIAYDLYTILLKETIGLTGTMPAAIDFYSGENENQIFDWVANANKEMAVVFSNRFKRVEDIMREAEGLILYRGSFNPIHHGHFKVIKQATEKFPNFKPCFHISLQRRDKEVINKEEIVEKINTLSKFGIDVLVTNKPYFFQTASFLQERYIDKKIVFPIGSDTLNRIVADSFNDESILQSLSLCTFFTCERKDVPLIQDERLDKFKEWVKVVINDDFEDDGISSTKIRNKEAENKINFNLKIN